MCLSHNYYWKVYTDVYKQMFLKYFRMNIPLIKFYFVDTNKYKYKWDGVRLSLIFFGCFYVYSIEYIVVFLFNAILCWFLFLCILFISIFYL